MSQAFFAIMALGLSLGFSKATWALDLEPWMTERRIIGEDNLEPVEKAQGTTAYDFSQAIARVEVMDGYGFCTATRVGEDLFLTNFHCDLGCDMTIFRMGYQGDIQAVDRAGFRCTKLLRKNELLDYALFAVEPIVSQDSTGRDARSYPILPLSRAPAVQNMRAILPSHPTGRMKVLDRSQSCIVSDPTVVHTDSGRDTMKHTCDTEGGSSGAPVIDYERGVAIGLHWGGKANEFNYAIPMTLILGDLEEHLEQDVFSRLQVTDH